MTNEEIDIDKFYDEQYSKYQEEARIPFTDYRDLEDKYEILEGQVKNIISLLQNNDAAGAYEYAVSEGLV